MLSARKAVLQMHEYHPPLAGRKGLRLDFNENTEGCSPRVLARIREITADDLARYPEREPVEAIAAAHLGLPQSKCCSPTAWMKASTCCAKPIWSRRTKSSW